MKWYKHTPKLGLLLAMLGAVLPLPAAAASETTVGLFLFFLLYVVGFIFAILLLFIFAQKGQPK